MKKKKITEKTCLPFLFLVEKNMSSTSLIKRAPSIIFFIRNCYMKRASFIFMVKSKTFMFDYIFPLLLCGGSATSLAMRYFPFFQSKKKKIFPLLITNAIVDDLIVVDRIINLLYYLQMVYNKDLSAIIELKNYLSCLMLINLFCESTHFSILLY